MYKCIEYTGRSKMETFLNIIPIIVPTIVAVGVMVFVSYRNKNAADNHQVRIYVQRARRGVNSS